MIYNDVKCRVATVSPITAKKRGEKKHMEINKQIDSGKANFALSGRLDTTTAPQLQDELIPAFDTAKDITLDITNLNYVSSAGLRVLLMAEKASKAANVPFKLTGVCPEIMEVFEMTGFTDILTIE